MRDLPLDPDEWPDASPSRAECFRDATVTFDAIGGLANNVIPGVALPSALGAQFVWFSLRPMAPGSSDFVALLASARLGSAERDALERTANPEPGIGLPGGTLWRVVGHVNDAASPECRPDGSYILDSTPAGGGSKLIEYTAAQAVELCRNTFVIDSLSWLGATLRS